MRVFVYCVLEEDLHVYSGQNVSLKYYILVNITLASTYSL